MVFPLFSYSTQESIFNILTFSTFTLVIVGALGLSQTAPEYLSTLNHFVKLYVCIFLIFRFNPFSKNKTFTPLDKRITFCSGMLILTTTFLTEILQKIKNIKR
jgi:hypothetical protein